MKLQMKSLTAGLSLVGLLGGCASHLGSDCRLLNQGCHQLYKGGGGGLGILRLLDGQRILGGLCSSTG